MCDMALEARVAIGVFGVVMKGHRREIWRSGTFLHMKVFDTAASEYLFVGYRVWRLSTNEKQMKANTNKGKSLTKQ